MDALKTPWLELDVDEARALAQRHGTPFFAFDAAVVEARVEALKQTGAHLLYAVKANPAPELLQFLNGLVDGLDVASAGEAARALEAGWPGPSLSFTGPAKTDDELSLARRCGAVVNVESERELDALEALGGARVRLRINPSTVFRAYRVQMTGHPSPFGFDEEALEALLGRWKRWPSLKLEGVHVHPGSQGTSVGAALEVVRVTLRLLAQVRAATGLDAREANVGGGFGVIAPGDEFDVTSFAEKLRPLVEGFAGEHGVRPVVVLEPGRWLVGPAGLYVTRVVRTKRSRGVTFVIVDGGVHHFMSAATFLMPPGAARAPVLNLTGPHGPAERVTITGALCTVLDTLGSDVEVPRVEAGDLLAFQGAGAYGASFSPGGFLLRRPAATSWRRPTAPSPPRGRGSG
ncbi:MAG: alanine racemase [Myxococcaceae bacterium]